jgi:hypothetical protein
MGAGETASLRRRPTPAWSRRRGTDAGAPRLRPHVRRTWLNELHCRRQLQDWASADGLRGGPVPDIQEYGRTRGLRTNKVMESLLGRVFGLALADGYATNAFPFIKRGGMSSALPFGDVVKAVRLFAAAELAIVRPTMVMAVGAVAHAALERVGISSIRVPHPAARIGNGGAHELAWRKALGRM